MWTLGCSFSTIVCRARTAQLIGWLWKTESSLRGNKGLGHKVTPDPLKLFLYTPCHRQGMKFTISLHECNSKEYSILSSLSVSLGFKWWSHEGISTLCRGRTRRDLFGKCTTREWDPTFWLATNHGLPVIAYTICAVRQKMKRRCDDSWVSGSFIICITCVTCVTLLV